MCMMKVDSARWRTCEGTKQQGRQTRSKWTVAYFATRKGRILTDSGDKWRGTSGVDMNNIEQQRAAKHKGGIKSVPDIKHEYHVGK